MRFLATTMMIVSGLALTACGTMGGKKPPPPNPDMEESLPKPKIDKPNDGLERIEGEILPQPKKKGFFSNLAKTLGADDATPNNGPCPAVRVLYDASRFVEIEGANKFENVGFTGEIQNVTSACRYVGEDPIEVGLNIDMALGKGPKAIGNTKDVKYWVAVTRKDIAPINKHEFTGRVEFPQGADRVRLITPTVRIEIPRAHKYISGANFEVIIGFELTDKQIEFNRDGIRFKIDAGAKN